MRGVAWNRTNLRWRASFRGRYLGEFRTEDEAVSARRAAEIEVDGAPHADACPYLDGPDARVPIFDRRGQVCCWAVIDSEDLPLVRGHRWCRTRSGYAIARIGDRIVYLHRVVKPVGPVADHHDRDRMNNRRSNLRPCSTVENSRNSRLAINNSSGFKGVSLTPDGRAWRARITLNRQELHLGVYADPEQAARAYDAAAIRLHGEFASPNSIVVRPALTQPASAPLPALPCLQESLL